MIIADYICTSPDCGDVQEHTVPSPAPDVVPCEFCGEEAHWLPSPIMGTVRRVEVVRGGWEKPEKKTWLDTRNLGEGQSLEDFQAQRRKVWRDHRMDGPLKEFKNK